MSWTLDWGPVTGRDLQAIPWQTAARISAAVMKFAATGRGAERTHSTDPRQIRVRVPGAEARLFLDPSDHTAYVLRIFPRE